MRRTLRDLLVIERILRDRDGVWRQIHEQRDLKTLIVQMLTSSVIALACYGAVLGASNGAAQAVSSAVKLPLLFLVTIGICLPTLYLFNLVFGARLSILQALSLVMLTVNVTSVLSLTFAPISLFFLVTAPNYEFFKLLNVSILVLTALVGLRFLISGMRGLNRLANPVLAAPWQPAAAPVSPATEPLAVEAPEPVMVGAGADEVAWRKPVGEIWPDNGRVEPHRPPDGGRNPAYPAIRQEKQSSTALLYVWILLFGFVGTQLGWTLRPFFGSPDEKFELFRAIDGNFYVDIVKTVLHLF
ncbi:hypothetical protein [Fodinicola acaciae]|uniref:hypothetical protein n=1 Tax=Fodinicola acaciae TaxID=2681555 RepID=UPI0013D4AED3|nr:hypothetical protein [Fodinicola acaciae]